MTSPAPSRPAASTAAVWLGLLTLYFVWGSTYIGIRVSVETIPAFVMASARFLLAGLLLLAWSVARDGPSALRMSRIEFRDSFIVGALLLGGGMGMVALGEQTVPAGITALLIALMPLWVAVLGRVVFGERTSRLVLVGIVIGLVGVVILVAPTGEGALAISAGGLAAVLLSPILWASGSLYSSHRARLPHRPLVATAVQMLCGALVLAVLALASGELRGFSPAAVTGRSWLAFAYLVLVGSGIAYTTYVWMLRVAPLTKIATYAYVNPIVAFLLGAILLGEELSARTVVAGVVIVAAVAIIVTARSRSGGGSDAVETIEVGEPALEFPLDQRAAIGGAPAAAPLPASPSPAAATDRLPERT
ncbi:MAG TPA: EamA family transporter [Candidatus Limnocylindrales bacterium]